MPPPLERSYPTRNVERFAALEAGLTREAVRAHMGPEPIPNPLAPDEPFANPQLEFPFTAPDGRRIEVWLYLVELRTTPQCPHLHRRERPVVFEEGHLAAWSWSGLGDALDDYGRTQDWYRKLRYPSENRCERRRAP